MSDRLTELQRQRALVQEQLAWLDREIAREAGHTAPAAHPPQSSRPAIVTSVPIPPAAAAEVDAILAQYRDEPDKLQKNVKLGCFLYFFAALGLLVLSVTAWYFLRKAH